MLDLLVVGAGLSGLCAALAAAATGRSVRIVAKGMGALHWSAGCVDLLGYLPNQPLALDDPLAMLDALPDEHPYRLLGRERVGAGLEQFYAWLRSAQAEWHGADVAGRNLLLPSPVGAVRPVFLAPAAQKSGEILPSAGGGSPMLIVGINGMRDFFPMLVAENLSKQGYRARAASVPWEAVASMRDRNTIQLAQGLEAPAQLSRLVAALKQIAKPGERIGLPAILGVEKHADVMRALGDALDAPIFEIPTLPPSVPGIRLYRTLASLLGASGVRIETNMEVSGFHAEDGVVRWVETATAARPLRHEARDFLLATGGILGGGFVGGSDGVVRETVFDLPLTIPRGREQWFRARFLDAAGQPVYRGGVRVDASLQPVNAEGAPIYHNLRAAGGALAGTDSLLEHSLEGVAIVTGIAAAG